MTQPPPTYTVDGVAIRNRRMSRGEEIATIAHRSGISRSYLTRLEIGIRRRMRPATYMALRTALGVAQDDQQLLAPAPAEAPSDER